MNLFLAADTTSTQIDTSLSYMGNVFSWIIETAMSNPVTATFFIAGLIGLGFGIFHKIKRA